MTETSELRRFLSWCNSLRRRFGLPIYAVRIHSGKVKVLRGWMHLAPTGTPDSLLVLDGHYVWVEWKRPGGKVTAEQLEAHAAIRLAGGVVEVFDDVATAQDWVMGILKRSKTAAKKGAVPPRS